MHSASVFLLCFVCVCCCFFWQERSQRSSWGSLENISFSFAKARAMITCCVLWEEIYLNSLRIWMHFIATSPSPTRCLLPYPSIVVLTAFFTEKIVIHCLIFCRKWMRHHFGWRRTLMVPCSSTIIQTAEDSVTLFLVIKSTSSIIKPFVLFSWFCHYLIRVQINEIDLQWPHSLLQVLLERLLKIFSTVR